MRGALAFVVILLVPVRVAARPSYLLQRAVGRIVVDGIMDEEAWAKALPITDFRQQEPLEGTPGTERTEVRVVFDDDSIYFLIRAFDTPGGPQGRDLTRDSTFSNDDKVEILLDTYHDRRNAYRFTVNPLGTQQDALVVDDGRQVNRSWDVPWLSAGRIDEGGYTVEIAIPLSILGFERGGESWGMNIARVIRRKNEEVLWSSWQRTFGLERVSEAGVLTGTDKLVPRRRREIIPYAVAQDRSGIPSTIPGRFESGFEGQAGIEVLRLGLTSGILAEATLNPDFGQAEVDEQVINLSRFSVFLPEKREFFLENSGIFLFGREESNQMFFTRRIGIESGIPVPLDVGLKVTGQTGGYELGLLGVQQRSSGAFPRRQFFTSRVKRGLGAGSYVGAMLAGRESKSAGDDHQAFGVDGQVQITEYWLVKSMLMGTRTGGVTGHSGRFDSRFETNLFRLIAVYEDISDDFRPQLGFASRVGIRQYFGQAAYKWRPRWRPVREIETETQVEYYEDRNGHLQSRQSELTFNTTFANSAELEFRPIENLTDVLSEPFEIRRGIVIPGGPYRFNRTRIEFTTDQSKRVVVTGRYKFGNFYSGDRAESSLGISWRPNQHWFVEVSDAYNDVRLREGAFTTNLFSARLQYNLSQNLLSSMFIQANNAAEVTSTNLRVRWIYRPHSDLFFIYNQSTGEGLERPARQIELKVAHYFRW